MQICGFGLPIKKQSYLSKMLPHLPVKTSKTLFLFPFNSAGNKDVNKAQTEKVQWGTTIECGV